MTPGTRLGPYEIVALIGAGGMGEVYRARDTKLKRDVAVKVLPEALAADPGRMARFQREAEVLAALNHPNIAQIYGVEERALVMELVEGESPKGPMPFEDAWKIASQMAEALEYAHDKGVVHRDLKPSNVKVTPDGVVKLLDFGLAKAFSLESGEAPAETRVADSPTLTMGATVAGIILGTAAYMAPEQARGKRVDKRVDIWSWGVMLYEMLTGQRMFQGEDAADTLAAVIHKQPELERVPAKVRRLLGECLQKDPKLRLRDIGDAKRLLAEEGAPTAPARYRVAWVVAAVALMLSAGLGLAAWKHFRETQPEAKLVNATILPPEGTTFDFFSGNNPPVISPDGRRIVFGARSADGKSHLWVRPLDSSTAQSLAGTDNATFPFWSPDSRSIAFFADRKLKRIDLAGGPPLTLADAPQARGGAWSPEGAILFNPANLGTLLRADAGGGTPSPVTKLTGNDLSHRFPWFLPDGRHFLFQAVSTGISNDVTIQVASLDSAQIRELGPATSNAVYSGGHLLFLRENTLMAQRFDEESLATTGDAVPIAEGIEHVFTQGRAGVFSVSRDGVLVYQAGGSGGLQQLTWFDQSGKQVGTMGDPGNFLAFDFSPDRKRVAVSNLADNDLWIYDVARGLPTRFTFGPGTSRNAVWSPDGRSIVYTSDPKGHADLYRKSSDFAGTEELLYADALNKAPTDWSPDGKFLLFGRFDPKTRGDVWVLPLVAEPTGSALKPFPFLNAPFNEGQAKFSPDGHWVAYTSDESSRQEIYVAPFPGPGGKRRISNGGGIQPRWRADGREIFYRTQDGTLMAAEVAIRNNGIEVDVIRSLGIRARTDRGNVYDASADGQRFLVATAPEQKSAAPLTLVQNWPLLLKKR